MLSGRCVGPMDGHWVELVGNGEMTPIDVGALGSPAWSGDDGDVEVVMSSIGDSRAPCQELASSPSLRRNSTAFVGGCVGCCGRDGYCRVQLTYLGSLLADRQGESSSS